jgi:LemA protein
MNIYIIVAVVVVIVLAIFFISTYNSLVQLRQRVQNSWSQVDVQLKRRYDLIPNLINTVKGYADYEREVLEKVTQARNMAISAGTIGEHTKAENMLSGALKSLFAVAEAYPDLKANGNFMKLQNELSDTESKIAFSRQFYNDIVQKFNTKIELFPSNLVAGMMGFQIVEYFTLQGEAEARENIQVKF